MFQGSWNEWRLRADPEECETGPPRLKAWPPGSDAMDSKIVWLKCESPTRNNKSNILPCPVLLLVSNYLDGIARALFIIYPWGDRWTWFNWKLNPVLGCDYDDDWNGAIWNDSPHIHGDLLI